MIVSVETSKNECKSPINNRNCNIPHSEPCMVVGHAYFSRCPTDTLAR